MPHFTRNRPRPNSSVRFPQRMHAWYQYSTLGTSCYIELGPVPKSDVHTSCKIKSSGKSEFRRGRFKDNGPYLGEAKAQGVLSSKSIITLSNGAQASMSSASSFRNKGWLIGMNADGMNQTWLWANHGGGRMSLVSADGRGPPVATMTPTGGVSGVIGSTIGIFEFHGPALTGQLGGDFQIFAVLSWMRITQKVWERKFIRAVT